jgi:hypothetical protein
MQIVTNGVVHDDCWVRKEHAAAAILSGMEIPIDEISLAPDCSRQNKTRTDVFL